MATGKKSFVLYADYDETFQELSNEDAGKLIKHIFSYVNDRNPVSDNAIVKLAFIPIKQQLKRDLKQWEDEKKSRSEAGKKGMANRWGDKPINNSDSKSITKDNSVIPVITKITDNVTVTVNDTVNVLPNGNIDNAIFVAECLKAKQWCDAISKQYKILPEKLESRLGDFCAHLITVGKQKENLEEFKKHFSNWLRKKAEINPESINGSNSFHDKRKKF